MSQVTVVASSLLLYCLAPQQPLLSLDRGSDCLFLIQHPVVPCILGKTGRDPELGSPEWALGRGWGSETGEHISSGHPSIPHPG